MSRRGRPATPAEALKALAYDLKRRALVFAARADVLDDRTAAATLERLVVGGIIVMDEDGARLCLAVTLNEAIDMNPPAESGTRIISASSPDAVVTTASAAGARKKP